MAFWGVEVKPGKPYTHLYDSERGRLRICQAVLGNGKAVGKSVVQCNVGNKSPVLLCNLIPDVSETCHLELEFEEADEVIFSVIGQRSVHLSGYYVVSRRLLDGDETDSYGEDISGTDTSGSYGSDDSEDEYESDFIDDGDDRDMFSSPPRISTVVIEEIVEDEKPPNGNVNRHRLKKKHQLGDSDDEDVGSQRQLVKHDSSKISGSEDEDGFPISFSSKRKTVKESEEKTEIEGKTAGDDKKRKIAAINQDANSARQPSHRCDSSLQTELGSEDIVKSKKKKKSKDSKSEAVSVSEERASREPLQDQDDKGNDSGLKSREKVLITGEDAPVGDEVEGVANDGKQKVKREKVKKGKTSAEKTEVLAKESSVEATNNDDMDQDDMAQDPPIGGEPEKIPSDKEMAHSAVTSDAAQQSNSKLKKKKKKGIKDDNLQSKDGAEVVRNENDRSAEGKAEQKSEDRGKSDQVPVLSNDNVEPDSRGKKKKNKSNKDSVPSHGLEERQSANLVKGTNEVKAASQPHKIRELGKGLIVEELAMGKPDGKRASPSNKVSVNYIGKLKNGTIFDSNVGKRPFKFRLGIGEVIKGWDIGIEGMRVGDKRRLTIPPAFGYGEKAMGKIPPNSWLVFEVELVAVH